MEMARVQEEFTRARMEADRERQRATEQTVEIEKLRARLHALETPSAPPTLPRR